MDRISVIVCTPEQLHDTKMPTMCTPGHVQHVKSAGVGTIALIAQKGASARCDRQSAGISTISVIVCTPEQLHGTQMPAMCTPGYVQYIKGAGVGRLR
jgi:hypothetical protein